MSYHSCSKCLDAGVVEAVQANFKTLALCFCKQGRKQGWALPMIPLKEFKDQPLNWREYKPTEECSYDEKIAWHLERVKTAEQFWKQKGEE